MSGRVVANVVLVLISADGTISAIGPFLSRQRASRWLSEHPEYGDDQGFQTSIETMDSPRAESTTA